MQIKLELTRDELNELMTAIGVRRAELTERGFEDLTGKPVYQKFEAMLANIQGQIVAQVTS